MRHVRVEDRYYYCNTFLIILLYDRGKNHSLNTTENCVITKTKKKEVNFVFHFRLSFWLLSRPQIFAVFRFYGLHGLRRVFYFFIFFPLAIYYNMTYIHAVVCSARRPHRLPGERIMCIMCAHNRLRRQCHHIIILYTYTREKVKKKKQQHYHSTRNHRESNSHQKLSFFSFFFLSSLTFPIGYYDQRQTSSHRYRRVLFYSNGNQAHNN